MLDSYERIFTRRADGYRRAMASCPNARDAEFRAVAGSLDADAATVIDMPAGSGWLRPYLPAGTRYVAVEPVGDFCDGCPEDDGAERICSPIETVPRADASADVVISLAGLHHAPDLGAVFREARRLLRIGGTLVIADVGADTGHDRFLNSYVDANNPMGHQGRFLDAATAPALRAAGFDIVTDRIVETPWRFATPIEAGGYCADLFGIEGCDALAIVAALHDMVGTATDGSGFRVDWSLRRIICRAV